MRPQNKFFLVFTLIFSILVTSCDAKATGPNLWKVADEDTTIYIFGTIHLLNQNVDFTTPQLQRALEEADALVLELAPDQEEATVINPLIVKYGLLPAGETLKTTLADSDYDKLTQILNQMGAPAGALDSLQPWLAATYLTVQTAASFGFLPEFGVENILRQRANDRGIPILGLETAEYQIQALAGQSMETQEIFLQQTLVEIDIINEIFIEMRDAWLAGDIDELDSILNLGMEEMPELAEAILYKRNRNWVGRFDIMLAKPGTLLVAVGTGHLVGEQNLLELLEEEGLTVSLVQE